LSSVEEMLYREQICVNLGLGSLAINPVCFICFMNCHSVTVQQTLGPLIEYYTYILNYLQNTICFQQFFFFRLIENETGK
jgi:hypothetical protein